MFVDGPIVLGTDKLDTAVVAESPPFRVDHHLLRFVKISVPQADVFQFLDVAGVGTSTDDQTDPTARVLPCAGHQRPRRIVQDGHDVDLNIAATRDSFLIRAEVSLLPHCLLFYEGIISLL